MIQALSVDQLAISDFIEREVFRVLTRKFKREPGALQWILDELLRSARRVQIHGVISGICRDVNDDAILETAVVAKAELLITGDADLLSLKVFQGIAIVTPMDYIRRGSSAMR